MKKSIENTTGEGHTANMMIFTGGNMFYGIRKNKIKKNFCLIDMEMIKRFPGN